MLNLPANITIQAQSDVEIPEPASLALLGIGLAWLGSAPCAVVVRPDHLGLQRGSRH